MHSFSEVSWEMPGKNDFLTAIQLQPDFYRSTKKIPVSISATKGSSKEWSITWHLQPRWLTKNVLLSGRETKMPASSLCACGAAIEMNGNNGSISPGITELHVCGASAEPVVPQQIIDKQIKMQICKVSKTNLNATKWNCQWNWKKSLKS